MIPSPIIERKRRKEENGFAFPGKLNKMAVLNHFQNSSNVIYCMKYKVINENQQCRFYQQEAVSKN